jgi:hypothetical protein
VGGLGGVHPDAGPGGIGREPPPQQFLLVRGIDRAELGGLGVVSLTVLGQAQPLGERAGGPHGGARPVDRVEPGEGEPGLVPQEDQVGLDGEALLHHPANVVDDPVERAVGQQQHLDPVQLAGPAQRQQLARGIGEGYGTVHGVLVQRVRVQVGHHGAGQHQPVVMGLVAVAVDQDDVPRLDQRLDDDLIGGRGAVGDEVGLPRAERLGRELLRLAQWPSGLEQRVKAAAGRGGLGQEDFQAVEIDHVLDPVRVDDRFAVRDRHRMEDPGWAVAVVTQRAEERSAIPGADAVQDG